MSEESEIIRPFSCANAPDCGQDKLTDYNSIKCPRCERKFCEVCAKRWERCENCEIPVCDDCIIKDKDTGFLFCGEECKKEGLKCLTEL